MEVRCRTTYKLHRYMIEIKYNSRNVQSMEKSDHYQRAIDPSSLGEHYYTNEKIAAASLRACMCVSTNLGPETTSEKDFLLLGNNEGFCLSGKLLRLVGQCTVCVYHVFDDHCYITTLHCTLCK